MPGEVATAFALAVIPSVVSFCSKTSKPPIALPWNRESRTVIFQPAESEAFSPSQSSDAPSAREVAELVAQNYEFGPEAFLQEASDVLLEVVRRPARFLTLRLASEGVRRLLDTNDPLQEQPSRSRSRFTRGECETVARALFQRAGFPPRRQSDDDGDDGGKADFQAAAVAKWSTAVLETAPLPSWVGYPVWAANVAGRAAVTMGTTLQHDRSRHPRPSSWSLSPFGLTSQFVELPGLGRTMHFFDSHPHGGERSDSGSACPSPPPLILIHGMFTNALSMVLLAAALSDRGRTDGGVERRVIVPDLIGSDFGCSSSVRGRGDGDEVPFRNDIKSHTSSLVKLVDALGLGSVDLLGHSFGGFLAQDLACALPCWRVRRVVLLCPGGGNRYHAAQSLRTVTVATHELFTHARNKQLVKPHDSEAAAAATTAAGTEAAEEAEAQLPLSSAESSAYLPSSKAPTILKESIATQVLTAVFRRLLKTPTQSTLVLDFFDQKKYFLRFHWLPHVPALLLWGDEDSVIEPRTGQVQMKHLSHPHSRGFWVEGGSHALNFDSVRTVYELAKAFLRNNHDFASESADGGPLGCGASGGDSGWFARQVVARMAQRTVRPMERRRRSQETSPVIDTQTIDKGITQGKTSTVIETAKEDGKLRRSQETLSPLSIQSTSRLAASPSYISSLRRARL